jgi:hypothetical protein
LLFHEVCTELGIPATLVLPIPVGGYRRDSVADGGAEWIERFNKLVVVNEPVILSDSNELPVWAKSIPDYSVFQRGNIWMMPCYVPMPTSLYWPFGTEGLVTDREVQPI